MPVSPNDPDYQEIMAKYREQVEEQRIKTSRSILTPRGYAKQDPEYRKALAKKCRLAKQKRQKEKEQNQ